MVQMSLLWKNESNVTVIRNYLKVSKGQWIFIPKKMLTVFMIILA